MSIPAKSLEVPRQIELFDSWFAGADEPENSRTLAFWDLLPWHLVSRKRSQDVPEPLTFEGVRIADGCEANVTLTPAILREPGSKTSKVLFPGDREELVERALRKMTVHKLAESQAQPNTQDNSLAVAITFSLHQLRQELIATGHAYPSAHIREALQVMERCHVAVECQRDSFVHGKNGTILPTIEYVADPKNPDGPRTFYRVTFHPLASSAILGELYLRMIFVEALAIAR